MRRAAHMLAPGYFVVATTLAVAGCSAGGETLPARANVQETAVPVDAGAVVQKAMPMTIDVIGTAEAYSTVAVHAQITGELTSVNFKDGDDVGNGQVLFTLDRRPLDAALQQMEANLERDIAQLANARSQLRRYQDLADRGIATKEQLDQSQTNTAALEATAAADRAAVQSAQVQLEYATIKAPLAGRTGKLMVHAGNLVRANDTTPLVVINQVSPIYVSFGIPEAQLPDLKRYMTRGSLRVEARAPTDAGPVSSGQVSFVDNAIDQTTGTITVRGTFPNGNRQLWPGQFVNVVVTLDTEPNAIVVPTTAVQEGQQGKFVFVVKPDKTVEMRTIHAARTSGQETVVLDGVKPGETVVTGGQLRLAPGSRITIRTGSGSEKTPS
jgi:multidrug efflux system membrane fusion protein